ncbi:MAG: GNAT family N-acetyltransferase [Planctomycetota bacterium]
MNRLESLEPIDIARREEERQARGTAEIANESEPFADGTMSFLEVGSWANQACAVGLHGPVTEDAIDRFVDFYVSRGVEPRIEVATFADPTLVDGLARRGFTLREFENVLALDLQSPVEGEAQASPSDLRLEPVDRSDEAALRRYAELTVRQFYAGQDPAEHQIEASVRIARHPRCQGFVAWLDGEAVGGGTLEIDGDICSLIGAAVVPEYRRRGIQTAIMLHRLELARQAGCRLAVIHSKPGIATERNAARLGFRLTYVKVAMAMAGEGLVPSP